MNATLVNQVAAAVLYEGYILYPYRPSVKNRHRWTFGGLVPPAYSQAQSGTDACEMQTECLVEGGPSTTITVSVRWLQVVDRSVAEVAPLGMWPAAGEPSLRRVDSLRIGDELVYSWQEAVEQTIDLGESSLAGLVSRPLKRESDLPPRRDIELLRDAPGKIVGAFIRERRRVHAAVSLSAEPITAGAFRLKVRIENRTPLENAASTSRDQALTHGLASTHTVLGVRDGAFVSQIDPPEIYRTATAACKNVGTFPVLVGSAGERDTMLSASIILYDYPRIAPESPGDLFDSTEIDEILTLRIMTLTDEEKQAAAAVDQRARAVLERTGSLAREQLSGLHGMMRATQELKEEPRHA